MTKQADDNQPSVAAVLHEWIDSGDMVVQEIAKKSGISEATIRGAMDGIVKLPYQAVPRIAEVMGRDPVYLLRILLNESLPGLWDILEETSAGGKVLTKVERDLIDRYRIISSGTNMKSLVLDDGGFAVLVVPKDPAILGYMSWG